MRVTFCGHKDINTMAVAAPLHSCIENLIKEGATEFYLGGYGSFDTLAARTIRDLKKKYPNIASFLIIPYLDREYDLALYDGSIYPPIENVPPRFAITKRNEWMVQESDVVVAYVIHDWGGAVKTLKYAERKTKRIINIAEAIEST